MGELHVVVEWVRPVDATPPTYVQHEFSDADVQALLANAGDELARAVRVAQERRLPLPDVALLVATPMRLGGYLRDIKACACPVRAELFGRTELARLWRAMGRGGIADDLERPVEAGALRLLVLTDRHGPEVVNVTAPPPGGHLWHDCASRRGA